VLAIANASLSEIRTLEMGEATRDDPIVAKDLDLKPSPWRVRAEDPANSAAVDQLIKRPLHCKTMRW